MIEICLVLSGSGSVEFDIRFMKIRLTGGILQSIVCSDPLLFGPSIYAKM